jgi:hypothetical protein
MRESPANYGLSALSVAVSKLRKAATLERISQKSLANFPDIPVFGRLFVETDFEQH